jgi:hypothetical protein
MPVSRKTHVRAPYTRKAPQRRRCGSRKPELTDLNGPTGRKAELSHGEEELALVS